MYKSDQWRWNLRFTIDWGCSGAHYLVPAGPLVSQRSLEWHRRVPFSCWLLLRKSTPLVQNLPMQNTKIMQIYIVLLIIIKEMIIWNSAQWLTHVPPPSELKTLPSKELGTMVIRTGEGTGCNVTAAMAGCLVIYVIKSGSDLAAGMALWVVCRVTADRTLWLGCEVTDGTALWVGCLVTGRKDWEPLNARSTPSRPVVFGTHLTQLQQGGWWYSSRALLHPLAYHGVIKIL